MSMDQGFEAAQQHPYGNPGMAIPPSPAATEAMAGLDRPLPESHHERDRGEITHEIMDKAKHLGKTTIDAGTRVFHAVEEKIHDMQEKDMPPEKAKKARMMAGASAGTVAIASTVGMAIRKRHHRQSPAMHAPRHIMARAKDMLPSR